MQNNPQMVLNRLRKYSTTENPKYRRLYANLYSVEFFKLAYSNIYSKPGNMTRASDGSTIDGMSLERINKLIQSLKDGTYQPTNLRRINIPKKNGDSRPISIPSFNDKLVQEVIRMILEAIYEDSFSDYSHGFRPNRSCHTALDCIRTKFKATVWFIEGDIKGCFDNIDHEILLNTLREKIYDLRFIHLINLFLKAGYIENWQYHKTYSGVPQGSIIGPILSNIYLDKFDKFMEKKISDFNIGSNKKSNPIYGKLRYKLNKTTNKFDKMTLKNKLSKTPKQDPMDSNYKRLKYIRYADDFLIGVSASKKETFELNHEISEWFQQNLCLKLSDDKNKITHSSKKPRFLGYDIVLVRQSQNKYERGNIRLSVPYEVMVNFIINNRYGKWKKNVKTNKDELFPTSREELTTLDEYEILQQYNLKLLGIYNYYSLAENVCKLNGFSYIIHSSFFMTLGHKYQCSRASLYKNKNYCQNKRIGITRKEKFYELFWGPFKKRCKPSTDTNIDNLPNINKYSCKTSLIRRLEANRCEWCGDEEGPFEVHHIHKLKDLKGKSNWEKLIISRQRKTLVLCVSCHDKLHAGKL